jgi:anthranilate/para-aminobenzoate synthase component I
MARPLQMETLKRRLTASTPTLPDGVISGSLTADPKPPKHCNMEKKDFLAAVEETKEHVRAGDVFQLVLSQRFERNTFAEPFEIYRALRIVNPSPYMAYLQVLLPFTHSSLRLGLAAYWSSTHFYSVYFLFL